MKLAESAAPMGGGGGRGMKMQIRFYLETLKGTKSFGRSWRRYEDNNDKDLKSTVSGCGMDSSDSGWDPVAGYCEHDIKHSDFIKGGEFLH
jgi:hypothetical protein